MEETPLVIESETEDRKSREAPDQAESQHSPERIGHVLITSEAKPDEKRQESAPEANASSLAAEKKMEVEASGKPGTGKRIDTLSRGELMDLAEKITVEGSNLRQIYETHLIGERGLRRLVAEHLGGGDLQKALRQEVLERERDFERDPVMRDMAPPSAAAPTASSNAALEKLLEKAAVNVANSGEEAAFFKARARYEAVHQRQHHQQQRRLVDTSLFVIITILVVLVIFMYLTRG